MLQMGNCCHICAWMFLLAARVQNLHSGNTSLNHVSIVSFSRRLNALGSRGDEWQSYWLKPWCMQCLSLASEFHICRNVCVCVRERECVQKTVLWEGVRDSMYMETNAVEMLKRKRDWVHLGYPKTHTHMRTKYPHAHMHAFYRHVTWTFILILNTSEPYLEHMLQLLCWHFWVFYACTFRHSFVLKALLSDWRNLPYIWHNMTKDFWPQHSTSTYKRAIW